MRQDAAVTTGSGESESTSVTRSEEGVHGAVDVRVSRYREPLGSDSKSLSLQDAALGAYACRARGQDTDIEISLFEEDRL